MVVVPAVKQPRVPVPNPIVPTAVVLLTHVPPGGVPKSVVVEPSHNCIGVPLIADGGALITTTVVR